MSGPRSRSPPACRSHDTVTIKKASEWVTKALMDAGDRACADGGGEISLATQAIDVVTIAAFVAVASGAVFLALKATVGIRVSPEEEMEGLDVHEHGIPGYAPDVLAGAGTPKPGRSALRNLRSCLRAQNQTRSAGSDVGVPGCSS